MIIYSRETSQKYSDIRDSITATDGEVFELLNRVGVRSKNVLDFGCGDGRYAIRFAEMGAKSIVGIDISPTMIEIANHRLTRQSNIKFLVADGNNLPFPDHSFDLVFANFVLHHFKNSIEPLREINRILRNGGHCLSTFPVTAVVQGADSLFNTLLPIRLGRNNNFVIVYPFMKSTEEMRENFEKVGLCIVEYREIDNPDAVIDPSFPFMDKVESYKTILCLAQKI